MRKIGLLAFIPLLPSCQAASEAHPTPPSVATGKCDENALVEFVGDVATDRFIGQVATAELGAQMLAKSGARTLRWGAPGMAMTMDYRPDRLTVSYDEKMLITLIRCG